MLHVAKCRFNVFGHNMCTMFCSTLCIILCSQYKLFFIYPLEGLEIEPVHVCYCMVLSVTVTYGDTYNGLSVPHILHHWPHYTQAN